MTGVAVVAPGTRRCSSRGITLIELLVAMVVMGILTTMILGSWFALQSSASSASQQSIQRDDARLAMSRMAAEIRDVESRYGYPAITTAQPFAIIFSSTFNNPGNENQGQIPHLVRYQYSTATGVVTRTEDTDNDGLFSDESPSPLLANVVNGRLEEPVPIFTYSYYGSDGVLRTVETMPVSTARIVAVGIRLLVDVKPNKSPTFMDLATSVQPRNLRN